MNLQSPAPTTARASEIIARDVLRYLERLPAASWSQPSSCAGWTIAGLVGHLILVEGLLSGSVERGLRGDAGPPPEAAAGVASWRAARDEAARKLSALSPDELLGRYAAGLELIQQAFAGLAAPAAAGLRGWHPAGAQPLPWFIGQWFYEISLHDWDLRVSFDPTAEPHPIALPFLGGEVRARIGRSLKPEAVKSLRGVVRFALAGADAHGAELAPEGWLLQLDEHGYRLLEDGALEPNATVQTDPAAYALVQTVRRPAAFFSERGRWQVSGDSALTEQLVAALSSF